MCLRSDRIPNFTYLERISSFYKCGQYTPSPCFTPSLQSLFYTDHNTNLTLTNPHCISNNLALSLIVMNRDST